MGGGKGALRFVAMIVIATMVGGLNIAGASTERRWDGDFVDKTARPTTELVSYTSEGKVGKGASDDPSCLNAFDPPSLSDDGRFVAFTSHAGDLHPADVNGSLISDVFVRDRKRGTTDIVSVLPSGLAPELPSLLQEQGVACAFWNYHPAISGNGRYVAFASFLPLDGDLDLEKLFALKLFVRDLEKAETTLVAVVQGGTSRTLSFGHNPGRPGWSSLSRNGRYIAFTSWVDPTGNDPACAHTRSPVAPSGCRQIYLFDQKTGRTTLVSKSSEGERGDAESWRPYITTNGRYIAFNSEAGNLTSDVLVCTHGTSTECRQVFIHDPSTGKTELASVGRDGTHANSSAILTDRHRGHLMSSNGRYIKFGTIATSLVPNNGTGTESFRTHDFVRDRRTGRVERVSVNNHGGIVTGTNLYGSITGDGRYVHFTRHGAACALGIPCDGQFTGHVIHDRRTGQNDVMRVLFDSEGQHDSGDWLGSPDRNGRHFAWSGNQAYAHNEKTTGREVFILDYGARAFKTGTGSVTTGNRRGSSSTGTATVSASSGEAFADLPGAQLIGASIAHRPDLDDLHVRIEVDRLPVVTGTNLISFPILYGMRFDTPQGAYEVRAGGIVGSALHVPFGLFRCAGLACEQIAAVKGSYGTTGERVTFSLPLEEIGLQGGGEISNAEVFSALGTHHAGVAKVLDLISFARH